jgi:nitroreductase
MREKVKGKPMDLFEAIHSRRTIRTFTGKKIPKDDLERIVDAGRLAPSATNGQRWDFVVITDRPILDEIVSHFHTGRKYGTLEDGQFDGTSASMNTGERTGRPPLRICCWQPET